MNSERRNRETGRTDGSPAGRGAAEIDRALAERLAPGLYLVATPIGNLGDITLRALGVLARADMICCEDTRHSRKLLTHFGIATPVRSYHEHNAEAERPRILKQLERGQAVALISDAGTPLISDPGYKLVRSAIEAGHRIESLPGASAALAALTSSGLPTDTFLFAGFLPPKPTARRTRLRDLREFPATLIFYEAPSRAAETLHDMADVLGPRPAAMARELTKLHEEVRRAPLDELARLCAGTDLKGELVLIVGPPAANEITDDMIADRLRAALETMSLRDAAEAVADGLGVAKKRVYDLGLQAKRRSEE